MADKWVVIDGVGQFVPLTPEEIAQQEADHNAWLASKAVRDAEAAQIAGINADADTVDLMDRLTSATNEQIRTYIMNNVTDLATARQALIKMALCLAILARRSRPEKV